MIQHLLLTRTFWVTLRLRRKTKPTASFLQIVSTDVAAGILNSDSGQLSSLIYTANLDASYRKRKQDCQLSSLTGVQDARPSKIRRGTK